jgi:N-(2-amino-2-carboxyethyl)-L-glutamate synthase
MRKGILSAIGNTPLIELTKVFSPMRFQLFAKLEVVNPGGSMKDRPAFEMLRKALESGDITSGTVVIESSSGNMGIGLAQACSYFGLRFICVADSMTTIQNIRILQAYGAEVDVVTKPSEVTGGDLQARLDRVQELLGSTKNGFWPNQYLNIYNAIAHQQTMNEIVTVLEGRVITYFAPPVPVAPYVVEPNMYARRNCQPRL